jgi:hypothetical protein
VPYLHAISFSWYDVIVLTDDLADAVSIILLIINRNIYFSCDLLCVSFFYM